MTRFERNVKSRQVVQFPSESGAEDIAVRVVELFAELEGCDPTELPQLQETVDTDALETVLTESDQNRYFTIEFEYNDAIVSITNEGRISVQKLHR